MSRVQVGSQRLPLSNHSCPGGKWPALSTSGLQEGDGLGVNLQSSSHTGRPAAETRLVGGDSTHLPWNQVCRLVLEDRCERKGLELCLLASVQTLNTIKICGQIRTQTRITTHNVLDQLTTLERSLIQAQLQRRERRPGITRVQVPANGKSCRSLSICVCHKPPDFILHVPSHFTLLTTLQGRQRRKSGPREGG